MLLLTLQEGPDFPLPQSQRIGSMALKSVPSAARLRRIATAKLEVTPAAEQRIQSLSMWTSTVSEKVERPRIHAVALIAYIVLMICYSILAVIDWSQYATPVKYESVEARSFEAVALDMEIDCQDCRRNIFRRPNGELWRLSWDYTSVAGGCAGPNWNAQFTHELYDFCAAQNDPNYTPKYHYVAFAGCPNAFDYLIPFSFTPFVPFGVTSAVEECTAKCDATPGCQAIAYAMDAQTDPSTGQTFPPGTCALLSASILNCGWGSPIPTTLYQIFTYVREDYGNDPTTYGAVPSNPLDKCTISSNDVAMLQQAASADPLVASASHVPYRQGWGWNPDYIGTRPVDSYLNLDPPSPGFKFGPATPGRGNGSFYQLKHSVPLCYTNDDNTDTSAGMVLEMGNIPHHGFADPLQVGQAVVTVSSGSTFRQRQVFQLWHKNTMHLGLTVYRDEHGNIRKSAPSFANFQYDGRVDFGSEEGRITFHYVDAVQTALALQGVDNYKGIDLYDAMALDLATSDGTMTEAQAANLTIAEIAAVRAQKGYPNDLPLKDFLNEYLWRTTSSSNVANGRGATPYYGSGGGGGGGSGGGGGGYAGRLLLAAEETVPDGSGSSGINTQHESRRGVGRPPAKPRQRRRLNEHDAWGGVLLSLRLERFSRVYTDGHKPGWWDVFSAIGGGSAVLIGLIGMAITIYESVMMISSCVCSRSTSTAVKAQSAGTSAVDTQSAATSAV